MDSAGVDPTAWIIDLVVAAYQWWHPRFGKEWIHAWAVWSSGKATSGLSIAGLPMLWWGRIGKLAQFAAALVVLLDLLGKEKIERAAAYAEEVAYGGVVVLSKGGEVAAELFDPERSRREQMWLWINATVVWWGFFSKAIVDLTALDWPHGVMGDVLTSTWLAYAALAFYQTPHLVKHVLLPAAYAFSVVVLVVISPLFAMAWLFVVSHGHVLRWLGFTLFVVGFQFDLLAS